MIPEIIEKWENKKSDLEQYFKENEIDKYGSSYLDIVKVIFTIVINDGDEDYDVEKITVMMVIIKEHRYLLFLKTIISQL